MHQAPADPAVGRTVVQRNADALERICHKANNGTSSGPAKVDLQGVVDHDMRAGKGAGPGRCETSDGIPLTPAAVRRLACDAGIIPPVIGGGGQILDQGRRTRTVSFAQRRALIV